MHRTLLLRAPIDIPKRTHRPLATSGKIPFELESPLPKPKYKVHRRHYLTLHDALHRIDPTFAVKAFITDKPANCFDILCLSQKNIPRDQLPALIGELRKEMAKTAHVTVRKKAVGSALVQFYDKPVLTVGFGTTGFTMQDLNGTPSWSERELIRTSLNFDAEAWEDSWDFWLKEAVAQLLIWGREMFDPQQVSFHGHFWATEAYWARQAVRTDGAELYMYIKDNFHNTINKKLAHPFLRVENMHTISEVDTVRRLFLRPNVMDLDADGGEVYTREELATLRKLNEQTRMEVEMRRKNKKKKTIATPSSSANSSNQTTSDKGSMLSSWFSR